MKCYFAIIVVSSCWNDTFRHLSLSVSLKLHSLAVFVYKLKYITGKNTLLQYDRKLLFPLSILFVFIQGKGKPSFIREEIQGVDIEKERVRYMR